MLICDGHIQLVRNLLIHYLELTIWAFFLSETVLQENFKTGTLSFSLDLYYVVFFQVPSDTDSTGSPVFYYFSCLHESPLTDFVFC